MESNRPSPSHPGAVNKRIVLPTSGSLGDLHPYLALALGLQARGHTPVIATSETFRPLVEPLGIAFHPVRPDLPELSALPELMHRTMDRRGGGAAVFRDYLLPTLADQYADTLAAAAGADLILSHPLTMAVRLVAETTGIAWASSVLQPMGFLSIYDPPVLAPLLPLARLRFLGPTFHRPLNYLVRLTLARWTRPWHRLRAELGLPPTRENPILEGQHAPGLVLAMFSPLLATKQPDWPPQTVITGFCIYDGDQSAELPPELTCFLDDGPPPIVFTLGSAAAFSPGSFYERSIESAVRLERRAVLVTGINPIHRPLTSHKSVLVVDYVPYSKIFPHAAAIVHQGGVGTTAQAMRAGRPMLVMPFAHDQFDNAARMARLGIGRTIRREAYTPHRVVAELSHLLQDPSYARRAAEIGCQIQHEDGVGVACNAIEKLLATTGGSSPPPRQSA